MLTDTLYPAKNLCHVRTKNTAVGMGFIEHNKGKTGKKFPPAGMAGHNAQIEHVGIGNQYIGDFFTDFLPLRGSAVAVIQSNARFVFPVFDKILQKGILVTG